MPRETKGQSISQTLFMMKQSKRISLEERKERHEMNTSRITPFSSDRQPAHVCPQFAIVCSFPLSSIQSSVHWPAMRLLVVITIAFISSSTGAVVVLIIQIVSSPRTMPVTIISLPRTFPIVSGIVLCLPPRPLGPCLCLLVKVTPGVGFVKHSSAVTRHRAGLERGLISSDVAVRTTEIIS